MVWREKKDGSVGVELQESVLWRRRPIPPRTNTYRTKRGKYGVTIKDNRSLGHMRKLANVIRWLRDLQIFHISVYQLLTIAVFGGLQAGRSYPNVF
jgi:hypothetical protein